MTHTEIIKMALEKYYKDYVTTAVLTQTEFQELEMLFGVIFKELNLVAPSLEQIRTVLTELRPPELPLRIIPLVFQDSDANSIKSYLDSLHSRELSGDQRTAEWKMQRNNFITASVSAACAGLMGPASRLNQLLEKASMGAYSPFKGGYYTDIGNIFEPVTNSHYSYINNTRIHDFALIPNNKPGWEFLAASTDGVAQRGTELTNIEIKTLPGRVPDGKVKKVYYHQMQHQMECLGLEHSDFIEVKYEEYQSLPTEENRPIGVIAELYNNEGFYDYEYSPAGATLSEIKRWMKLREPIIRDNTEAVFTRWIYWVQTHYSCLRVERDPTWLQSVGPALKQFFTEMVELRRDQKKVQQLIRDRDLKSHNKRTEGNTLFSDCLL